MIGEILQQRYQIVDFLGKGGQGHTYLAVDKHRPGNPKCVVKHLKPFFNEPRFLETAKRLFQTEAEILAKLSNYDQIPQLFAYFEQDSEFYLVEEFIDGQDLSKEIGSGKQLGELYAISLLKGILPILDVLHQKGVIHRDIKPPNIIRRKSDKQLVLIDFGAVKQFQHDLTHAANLSIDIGSPGYTPSEQLRGRPKPSSDIYALGMMCIQALTGVHPRHLEEDETEEVRWQHLASVNPILADILSKMVRHNTKERYKSAIDVLIALERLNYQSQSSATIAGNSSPKNPNSDSTIISPPPSSTNSSPKAQPYDPWSSNAQPSVAGKNATSLSRNGNSQGNKTASPSASVTGTTNVSPPTSQVKENRAASPPNPKGGGNGFGGDRNSTYPLNSPASPQKPKPQENSPVLPSTTVVGENTFVPSQTSSPPSERAISYSTSKTGTNRFVADDSTHAIEPPIAHANTGKRANFNNPPLIDRNFTEKKRQENRSQHYGIRHSQSVPSQSNPQLPYRRDRQKNDNKKLYAIAIGGASIVLAVAGFFSVVKPMLFERDTAPTVATSNSTSIPQTTTPAKPTKTNTKTATTTNDRPKQAETNSKSATQDRNNSVTDPSSKLTTEPKNSSTTSKTPAKTTPPQQETTNSKPSKSSPGLSQDSLLDTERAEAKQFLARADRLAKSGDFKDAIAEADKISVRASGEYLNAQEKIEKWSSSLIEKAKQKYQGEGKLDEAISMLQVIPTSVSQVETAKVLIDKWNQEWTINENSRQEAQRAIVDGRWQDAIEAADVILPNNDYWKSKKAKLQEEILAKREASREQKQQQLANQAQQQQPQQQQPQQQPQQQQPQQQQLAKKQAQGQTQGTAPTASNNNANGCISGYVWRQITPDDRVCVTPQTRQQIAFDNSQIEERRNAAAYDPESCMDGYVWREAIPSDRICVTPEVRQQTIQDNAQAEARRAK
jgi:serine/threonine protein kinase